MDSRSKRPYLGIFDPPAAEPAEAPLGIDRGHLEQKWLLAQQELEQAAEWGRLPDRSTEFIYNPHLEVLRERLIRECPRLTDPEVWNSCQALIEKMSEDIGATVLGCTIWRTALLHVGLVVEAEQVADLQVQYLKRMGFTPEEPHAAEDSETATDTDGAEE